MTGFGLHNLHLPARISQAAAMQSSLCSGLQAPSLPALQPGSRPVRTSRRMTRTHVAATRVAQSPAPVQQPDWDYKYPHRPCSSPCQPGDKRCLQMEALFQNVLNYPRLPIRVCQSLPNLEADISSITSTVEALNNRYGSELVLFWLRRQPRIVEHDIDTLVGRAEHVRSMLDLRRHDLFRILCKNPNLFCLEAQLVRTRYIALHKALPLNHEQVKRLVHKCPLALNYQTSSIESAIDALRQVTYTRNQWQFDFERLTPSLVAFYLRDTRDILARLEYLVATGESPTWCLNRVFKVSNNLFNRHHRGFRAWRKARELRRQALALREQGQQAQQAQALAQVRAQLAQQVAQKQATQRSQAAGTGFGSPAQGGQPGSSAGSRGSGGGRVPRQRPGKSQV